MNLVESPTVIIDAANAIAADIYQLGIIVCIIAALWQAARSEDVTTSKVLIFGIIAICATFAINIVPFHPEQTKSLILFALPVYFAYLYYQKKRWNLGEMARNRN